ncbi:MAG: hypothetical protein WD847_07305 [Pirellulales bacterium]
MAPTDQNADRQAENPYEAPGGQERPADADVLIRRLFALLGPRTVRRQFRFLVQYALGGGLLTWCAVAYGMAWLSLVLYAALMSVSILRYTEARRIGRLLAKLEELGESNR